MKNYAIVLIIMQQCPELCNYSGELCNKMAIVEAVKSIQLRVYEDCGFPIDLIDFYILIIDDYILLLRVGF